MICAALAAFTAARSGGAGFGPNSSFKSGTDSGAFDPKDLVGPIAPPTDPAITRIVSEGKEIVITVWVPAGKQRVTLECRPRLGPGAWAPESRRQVDGRAGELEFRLSNRRDLELLRVRAESLADLPLPAAFYSGKSQFSGVISTSAPVQNPSVIGGNPGATGFNGGALDLSRTATFAPSTAGLNAELRSVTESDIWRIDGQTLYFFNQGRGLQVIDLANSDVPRLKGELPIAAYGEQMYLLPTVGAAGERFVALLLGSGCSDGGSVMVARVAADGGVSVANQLPFAGQLRESRLVGQVLYLAGYWWHGISTGETNAINGSVTVSNVQWQSDTVVTAYDLADPTAVNLVPNVLTLPANPDAISATDRWLFVATTSPAVFDTTLQASTPGTSTIEVIDISDPTGQMMRRGAAVTRGMVADKFKLSLSGDVLRVVSFRNPYGRPVPMTNWYSVVNGTLAAVSGGVAGKPPPSNPGLYRPEGVLDWYWLPAQTWMETFSLANPAVPLKLGELLLKENEQLYATRFAGDRAYVVTFRRVDPLFLVDLSDPARPAIRGQLEVPGFSTYLSPLSDDRLLAMGLDNGQPIVSLFDVADLTHPRLLSKVGLKGQNGWGYSEANNDEKAFNYSADAGLILFPWQGWVDGRSFQTIQLVDLKNDTLSRRGVIDHEVAARRATVLGDRVVSVSAAELLSVSIDDRDHPAVVAKIPLQYRVDRTWILNDGLVQLAYQSVSNGLASRPLISLATQAAPERPTGTLALSSGLQTLGIELNGALLHVLQQSPTTYRTDAQLTTNVFTEWVAMKEPRRETNVDVTQLPPEFRVTYTTNIEIKTIPQPPLKPILETHETVVTIPYPLFPTLVPYQTNIVCGAELDSCVTNILTDLVWVELPPLIRTNRTYVYGPEIPQPDLVVTNQVVGQLEEKLPGRIITNSITVVTNWYALPPVLQTNFYVGTNSVSIPVAGELLASVIDCSGAAPRLLGQSRLDTGVFFNAGTLTANWPAPDLLVWTDAGAGGGWYGPQLARLSYGGPGVFGMAMPIFYDGFWPGFWWRGAMEVHFLPVQVGGVAAPKMGRAITAGENQDWNAVHTVFAADGRLYFSHETRTQLPAVTTTNAVGVKPGAGTSPDGGDIVNYPVVGFERWETHHWLDVLDLTDPVEARWRPALSLPGPLVGVSHGGVLLYAQGGVDAAGAWSDPLQALSYDGLEVNLVAALPVNSAPMVVRPNGVVVMSSSGINPAAATLDSWALGTDAHWHRYAQLALPHGAVSGLHAYADGLVVADSGGSEFWFVKSVGPDELTWVGTGAGQCGLYPDWPNSDAALSTGLWMARGPYGLWNIRPETGPLKP